MGNKKPRVIMKFLITMHTYPKYNHTDKKRWYEYNEDEPLPELPWINNNNYNQYDNQKYDEDDGWTIVTKNKPKSSSEL